VTVARGPRRLPSALLGSAALVVALTVGLLPAAGSAEASYAAPSRAIVAAAGIDAVPRLGTLPPRTPTVRPKPVVPKVVKPAHVPLPARSGSGRRIVYSERVPQHAWLVDAAGHIVRDFPVSGRRDWPRPGTYRVYSKSPYSNNPRYGVTFRWMVRFTFGHAAAIGFHSIPRYYGGKPMQTVAQLGQPVGRGGCPHSADANALFLYRWAGIGTKVVVVR
jgi:hypothetical protein